MSAQTKNKMENVTEDIIVEEKTINMELLKSHIKSDGSVNVQVRLLEDSQNGSIILLSDMKSEHIIDQTGDPSIVTLEDDTQVETTDIDQTEDGQLIEEIYSCNSCGISFTSVFEHIQNYHNDQEVVVEMAEDEGSAEKTLGDVTLLHVMSNEEEEQICSVDGDATEEDANESSVTTDDVDTSVEKRILLENGQIVSAKQADMTTERWRNPQILNTLHEEQCVDREGRMYTRKVVKIERFWDADKTDQVVTGEAAETLNERNDDENGEALNEYNIEVCEPGDERDDDALISRIYHCSRCYTQYLNLEDFDAHTCKPAQVVTSQGKYKCDHCNITYGNSKSLCAHMKVHKNLKKKWSAGRDTVAVGPYRCGVCETVFPSNKSLRLHVRMHDPVRQRPIVGPVEYPTNSSSDTPLDGQQDRFHCNLCDKWIHVGYRRIHESVHTGEAEFNCDICNRKFYTEDNLRMHMNVHTTEKISNAKSDKPLPYECNYCSRQFARPHEKVKHERIHTGEKPHSCDICGKSFRVSYCLTLHMRTHTGARPYGCAHCGKRFKAHSVYNHHVLTHSNIRAYKCTLCPKAFKTSVQLAGHKNSHTKPFSCMECNRPFASLYAVRVHMETHKRQNNLKFNCHLCGASYARAFALKDHLKSQHNSVQEEFSVPEVNAAAMSIIPNKEEDVQMVSLVMENSDGEIEME